MKILLTGGAGYIGSHTGAALAAAGHDVVILDNFCNSRPDVLPRLEKICGRAIPLITGDIRDAETVRRALQGCDAVMHFAGLKAVGESVEKPDLYHDNNVTGSRVLFDEMEKASIRTIVFSSSATVYGAPQFLPITEDHPLEAVSPYGATKIAVEDMLRTKDRDWRIAILRYFNPAGAHDSALIGEDPNGVPNNLVPYVAKVAMGELEDVKIFGDDYDTPDGTGVRDYIHVMDLAEGHVAALDYLVKNGGRITANLGTGQGYSVRQVVEAYRAASGRKIPAVVAPRRPGDVAACYADVSKAARLLNWRAIRSLDDQCKSSWRWMQKTG